MRAPWIAGHFVLTLACGSDPAPTTSATPAPPTQAPPSPPKTSATPSPATPAPTPTPAPPPPTTDPALDALLPEPAAPISLAHARQLSREGTWLEAAAVYDALARQTPTEARFLAGRGFALASCGRSEAATLARADYERALTLASDDAMRSLVHYDLGLLDEREGHAEDARTHFTEANRLRPSRATREALARVSGGEAQQAEVTCELEPTADATAVADLRAVFALLLHLEREDYDDGEDVEIPETEAEAAALLCHGDPCDTTGPFVSDFVLSSGVFEAHVVVPRPAGGYWVIPRVGPVANGPDARCPDRLVGRPIGSLARPGATTLARVRVQWLESFWDECFGESEDDCQDGCWWDAREDLELVLDPATGRYAIGSARIALEVAVDEGESLLPEPAFVLGERGLELTACDRRDPVSL